MLRHSLRALTLAALLAALFTAIALPASAAPMTGAALDTIIERLDAEDGQGFSMDETISAESGLRFSFDYAYLRDEESSVFYQIVVVELAVSQLREVGFQIAMAEDEFILCDIEAGTIYLPDAIYLFDRNGDGQKVSFPFNTDYAMEDIALVYRIPKYREPPELVLMHPNQYNGRPVGPMYGCIFTPDV